jgi:hypothetical protein
MNIAIMQPYFFPYIGYFQLIAAVDQFVVYDDVQWIKGGWINRNRIQIRGQPHFITIPVSAEGNLKPICERQLAPSFPDSAKKIISQLMDAYRQAPHFEPVRNLVSRCLAYETQNVSELVIHSLQEVCRFLGILTPFLRSSDLPRTELRGVERVIQIVRHCGGDVYTNPIGGQELYTSDRFAAGGLTLRFLKTQDISYRQFRVPFVPALSIVDVLMFNSPAEVQSLLRKFELVHEP